ncbi:hypothetical protein ALISP_1771 [Alicycliphilus sp. B1]|nr:hypothetical protein ALISP_1771 [Alicycliphilus sp. B1]
MRRCSEPDHAPQASAKYWRLTSARRDHAHQRIHGRAVARHHHETARVLVQPVHDAGARHLHGLRIAPEQGVEESPAPVARRRMHHQARRLVDDEQMLVLMDHVQRQALGLEGLALLRGAHPHRHLVLRP